MSDTTSKPEIPVGLYGRVSDYKQLHGRFDSIEAQIEVCTDFIKRHAADGWLLAETFIDPAYSGKNMERPGMQALQEAIIAGRIKVVVSYKLERMLRSTDEWPAFRRLLGEHGCQLVSVSEGVAEDTASGRLKTNMLVSVAAYERENTAEKVRSKMHQQAKKGIWNGGLVPWGYAYDSTTKLLHPDPVEGPLVQRVYAKAAELVSLTQLAEELNVEGVRTRPRTFRTRDGVERTLGGRRIRSDWLRMVIRNPIYRGAIRYNGEEFAGRHAALVTVEVWEAANAAVRETLKPARCSMRAGRDKHFNLLKGRVVCADCGRALVPHASGKCDRDGKPYRYYTCNAQQKERADAHCRVRQVSAVVLERSVIGLLGQLAHHPKIVEAVLTSGHANARAELARLEKRLAVLGREIGQATAQLQNIVDALASGGVASIKAELRERIASVKKRKDVLLVERARLQQERDTLKQEQLAPEKICVELQRFDAMWERMSNEEKRELVALLIARVEVHAPAKYATTASSRRRALQLRIKLHLPELLSAEGTSAAPKKKFLAIDAAVDLPSGHSGEVLITAPFQHRLAALKSRVGGNPKQPKRREHPLERAQRWERMLQSDSHLTARVLAKREHVSKATASLTLRLLNLTPAVRRQVLAEIENRSAYHFGLRPLVKIARLPSRQQSDAFQRLLARWCPAVTKRMPAEGSHDSQPAYEK